MNRALLAKHSLLAGASMLAMMTAAGGAGAVVFNFTGASVEYTIPTTGLYEVSLAGAQGGPSGDHHIGGFGADAAGRVMLSAGEHLFIYVGGQGKSGDFGQGYGGGGGGLSLIEGPSGVLGVAGGGGGGGYNTPGGPGLATTSGGAGYGSNGGAGGPDGQGGDGGTYALGGNGGGGGGTSSYGTDGVGGKANKSGQGGGAPKPGAFEAAGGFPGGGGSGYSGGGGGAGFSGGGGGDGNGAAGHAGGGGGGGSYFVSFASDVVIQSGLNSGDGSISIAGVAGVPEPSTWAMMLTGFAGLGALASRRWRKINPV